MAPGSGLRLVKKKKVHEYLSSCYFGKSEQEEKRHRRMWCNCLKLLLENLFMHI